MHDDDPSESGERRRATRIPINTEFASIPSATFISDLSEYGVFVHTPSPSPRGSKLKLRFTVLLDDPVIIEAEGRVVRQQFAPVSGMGIEFTELEPEMILRINDVVSRQRPRDSGPPLRQEEDDDVLDAASTLTQGSTDDPDELRDTLRGEDTSDTAKTIRREGPLARGAASSGTFRPPGSFRPPGAPSSDENAKTAIHPPVDTDVDPKTRR